jgi:molybdate transport system substrate-binding protein
MDHLAARSLLVAGSRVELLGNRLVVIAPASTRRVPEPPDPLTPNAAYVLDGGKLAIGDPEHVPAGAYAIAALESMGWRHRVHNRLVPARDVRSVVTFVQRGEVANGIVYATDAAGAAGVKGMGTFPADAHPPIRYPLARCRQPETNPPAEEFYKFLLSEQAAEVFARRGFEVLAPAGG